MRIRSREELINALMDAAEMEHNLACLYLFAAYTMKADEDELTNVPEPDRASVLAEIGGWKRVILNIARQEMGHLGTVANLLSLLGAEAHFGRPNFPPPTGYYPPTATLELERFGIPALRRFVEFERHEDQPGVEALGVAPRGVTYQHVGELYQAIRQAFEEITADPDTGGIKIENDELFFGYEKAMDRDWTGVVEVHHFGLRDDPPTSKDALRKEIRDALVDIIEEGEGAQDPQADSHYRRFMDIAEALRARIDQFPGFDPARKVEDNPMSQKHRDADNAKTHVIENAKTRDVSELFNSFYGSMILALRQTYSIAEDLSDENRADDMRDVSERIMRGALRPLGTLLTRLPLTDDAASPMAGPGFELYRPMYVSNEPNVAWSVIKERLGIAERESARLKAETWPASDISRVFRRTERVAARLAKRIEEDLLPTNGGGH